MTPKRMPSYLAAFLAATILAACGGGDDGGDDPPPAPVSVGEVVVLTTSNRLVSFNRATPGTLIGSVNVSGLQDNESLVGIDIRPTDQRLYALSTAGRIYTVEASTGRSTLKATLRAATGDDNPYSSLSGTRFGVDFNPVADRLRVVSDTGQNLRINVDNGDTITDGTVNGPGGSMVITASAYTNSFIGAGSTRLLGIDAAAGLLYEQNPPNAGTQISPVTLGVSGSATSNGFDIDPRSNQGFAALTVGGTTSLYRIDLDATANAATNLGAIAGGEGVAGLALTQTGSLVLPLAASVVALTGDNRLVTFDPRTPATLASNVAITGLAGGETIVGIDVRPSDSQLYGLSSNGRIFTITPAGAATLKSTLAADVADTTAPYAALVGTRFSVDFNPAADRLRVISDTGQNLRINVDSGATTTDGNINRVSGAAVVAAAAYTNSFAGATTTTLFNLEANNNVLTRQVPPNDGTLVDVGPVGIDVVGGNAAFDIGGGGSAAYAALRPSGSGAFSLYSVSLSTGAATLLGNTNGDATLSLIGGGNGPAIVDIAVRF